MVLNEKYQTAIEEKYKGTAHADIASQLQVPKGTVDDWFRTRGVLSPYYKEFAEELNERRKRVILNEMRIKEEDVIILFRKIYNRLVEAVDDGTYKPKFMDFVRIWRMQRIMQGKPTNFYYKVCPICERDAKLYKYR